MAELYRRVTTSPEGIRVIYEDPNPPSTSVTPTTSAMNNSIQTTYNGIKVTYEVPRAQSVPVSGLNLLGSYLDPFGKPILGANTAVNVNGKLIPSYNQYSKVNVPGYGVTEAVTTGITRQNSPQALLEAVSRTDRDLVAFTKGIPVQPGSKSVKISGKWVPEPIAKQGYGMVERYFAGQAGYKSVAAYRREGSPLRSITTFYPNGKTTFKKIF